MTDVALVERRDLVASVLAAEGPRVTIVEAPVGFGKTELLTQLRAATADRPDGRSIAVTGPSPPITTLAEELDAPTHDLDGVVLACWRRAPGPLLLTVDDAETVPVADLVPLGELADRLPPNTRLVVSGRRVDPVVGDATTAAIRRLRVVDLGFSDAELGSLGRPVPADDVHRWPALVALDGEGDDITVALDETLDRLEPERRAQLLAAAVLLDDGGDLTDDDVARLDGPADGIGPLFGDLPLVDRQRRPHRPHGLWADAARRRLDEADRRRILGDAAGWASERGDVVTAAGRWRLAGDGPALHRLLHELVALPSISMALPVIGAVHAALAAVDDRASAATVLAEAVQGYRDGDPTAIAGFRAAADLAASEGATTIEAAALWHHGQSAYFAGSREPMIQVLPRLGELIDAGEPAAAAIRARILGRGALGFGDARRATTALSNLPPGPWTSMVVDLGYSELGWPERVGVFGRRDTGATESTDMTFAFALWMRGDVPPDLALAVAQPAAAGIRGRQLDQQTGPVHGVLAMIATMAGRRGLALEHAEAAEAAHPPDSTSSFRFTEAARVLRALAVGDLDAIDEEALAALDRDVVEPWPLVATWSILPALRCAAHHRPAVADFLDDLDVGPSARVAIEAGRALARFRHHDDPTAAAALPWSDTGVLRARVAPVQLAELLLAASIAEPDETRHELALEVPGIGHHWQALRARHVDHHDALDRLLAGLPAELVPRIAVHVLGPTRTFDETGREVELPRLAERRLLGLLAVLGPIDRNELAARLWPDFDLKRRQNNLSAALRRCHDHDTIRRILRVEGSIIRLDPTAHHTDLEHLEEECERARELEVAGIGSEAVRRLLDGSATFTGDLLAEEPEEPWLRADRARIRSLATSAACRAGELLLRAGDVDAAAAAGVRAATLTPRSERALRLRLRADMPDRVDRALVTWRDHLAAIGANDLTLDSETVELVRQVQASTG